MIVISTTIAVLPAEWRIITSSFLHPFCLFARFFSAVRSTTLIVRKVPQLHLTRFFHFQELRVHGTVLAATQIRQGMFFTTAQS
jgi:hypothetical protein